MLIRLYTLSNSFITLNITLKYGFKPFYLMIPLNIMMQLGIKTEKILFFLTMQILRYDVKKNVKKISTI